MTKYRLPSGVLIDQNSRIYNCKNFYWREATKNFTRMPSDLNIENEIIKIAQYMEFVREKFGNKPITITSWFRPPHVNKAVNGSTRSRHLVGDAVDFVINGVDPYEVYRIMNLWHLKGGLGKHRSFTHIDLRGWAARWSY